jgi:hypothetical protein
MLACFRSSDGPGIRILCIGYRPGGRIIRAVDLPQQNFSHIYFTILVDEAVYKSVD